MRVLITMLSIYTLLFGLAMSVFLLMAISICFIQWELFPFDFLSMIRGALVFALILGSGLMKWDWKGLEDACNA